ncbi:MAG: winged helix-turn-helix domain-containing protein [Haloferacaceae archaeon]
MEGVLWYVLTGTRGGENRVRILRAVADRPRNANQLAEELDLDYTTVRHHLDVLVENGIVEQGGEGYGAVYLPTDRARAHWETVEEIVGLLDESGEN